MTSDPRDYKLDIAGLNKSDKNAADPNASARPFLRVLFRCCNVYQRVYRDPTTPTYNGRCPKCGGIIRFRVGEGGTDQRFFVVE